MKRYFNIFAGLVLAALALAATAGLTGCSDDDKITAPTGDQGVEFTFLRTEGIKYFDGDFEVDDIRYIKVWILDAAGTKHELPTLEVYGEGDTVTSVACNRFVDGSPIPAGNYTLFEVWMYNKPTEAPFERLQVTKHNEFEIVSGDVTTMEIPLKFVVVLSDNPLNNLLMWICKEAIGDDESLWPWDLSEEFETYQDLYELPYLHLDIESGIVYGLIGFDFYGDTENGGGPWDKMEELPSSIAGIVETYFITVKDLPNFKRMNKNVDELHFLMGLQIVNTGFEGFPEELFDVSGAREYLTEIRVSDCPNFTRLPEGLTKLKGLSALHITGTGMTNVDLDFTKFTDLDLINFSDNKITSFGDKVFASGNPATIVNLSGTPMTSLPTGLTQMENLRTLQLTDMGLTSVPAQVRNSNLDILDLSRNNISAIGSGDFAGMSSLENLFLAENPLSSVNIVNDAVKYINLDNCGLTAIPSLAGIGNIRGVSLIDNAITNVSINLGVAANGTEKLRYLDLSHNSSLRTVNITQNGNANVFPDRFRYLLVNSCPSLTFTAPAAWNAREYGYSYAPDVPLDERQGDLLILISPDEELIEGETEVWIDKRNSNGVTIP